MAATAKRPAQPDKPSKGTVSVVMRPRAGGSPVPVMAFTERDRAEDLIDSWQILGEAAGAEIREVPFKD